LQTACSACAAVASFPDLQAIIDAWPKLPAKVRRQIVADVEAHLKGKRRK